ncbi:MAG TPA: bacteriohopanetetrol glucosamine biosynthesis glycosyltransferase HpnI [Aestuariivirgaceae bacterium]|jgi:ceramide glucosyltransferase|nr:bacteriohopanetetrol glucosamine biosynthesis glycosyltransferase HpnI [Aestuariivirgaceae bacterium]
MTGEVMAAAFLGLSMVGCLYVLGAAVMTLCFERRDPPLPSQVDPVTILKPLCGDEPHLYERLRSFCTQDFPAPVQVVLGVQDLEDPALGPAIRLAAAFPDRVEVTSGANEYGSNRKVANLIGMARLARHDIIIISDSDIEVEPDFLLRVVGALQRPEVIAVTCLYHGIARSGLWSRLFAMTISTSFLPNVISGLKMGLAQPCFGSTIAIRRQTLGMIGGLAAFADQLADDYAIGMAVRRLGVVAIPGFTVGHACHEDRLASLWLHELRWARTVRAVDPIGFAGTIITHPLALALLGALFTAQALWLVAGALACEFVLCLAVERRFKLPSHAYWMIPLRDLLSFTVYISSFAGRTVHWRDQDYHVAERGTLRTEKAAR